MSDIDWLLTMSEHKVPETPEEYKKEIDALFNALFCQPNGPGNPEWAAAHAAMGFATPAYEVFKELGVYDEEEEQDERNS